nr:hypothetical protein [Tanacetum cinerariifolium]
MSDNIPLQIQHEIIKWLPLKPLLKFRPVSKTWKSIIDSSKFINDYHIIYKHSQCLLLQYEKDFQINFRSIVDDDTFPQNKPLVRLPDSIKLLKNPSHVISCFNGLFCLPGYFPKTWLDTQMAFLWNPFLRKIVRIAVPRVSKKKVPDNSIVNVFDLRLGYSVVGFGVCLKTNDVKILMVNSSIPTRWVVKVFTLSSRAWRSLSFDPSFKSCDLSWDQTEMFGQVRLLDIIVHSEYLRLSKRNECLTVVEYSHEGGIGVWMIKDSTTKSFTKIFTVKPRGPSVRRGLLEFRKNGEAILAILGDLDDDDDTEGSSLLEVYNPFSGRINDTGIGGIESPSSVGGFVYVWHGAVVELFRAVSKSIFIFSACLAKGAASILIFIGRLAKELSQLLTTTAHTVTAIFNKHTLSACLAKGAASVLIFIARLAKECSLLLLTLTATFNKHTLVLVWQKERLKLTKMLSLKDIVPGAKNNHFQVAFCLGLRFALEALRFVSEDLAFVSEDLAFCLRRSCVLSQKQCVLSLKILRFVSPEWSRFVTIVKQQHKLDEVSYHKLFDILKQFQNEVNELRVERKPKRVKDFAYHKEKMLPCKQAEQGVPLQAEQYDCLADTDEEVDEQELEAHYSYMAKIQEVPTADSGTDSGPVEHNDQNDVESDDECVALANLISNLKLDVDENKKIQKKLKKANTTLSLELKECKAILSVTSMSLGESISVRDSCLVALQI